MPRFYFDIRDRDGSTQDKEGLIHDTLEEAIQEARKALHEMAKDEPSLDHLGVTIEIRQGDQTLVTVTSTTTILPESSAPLRKGWSG